MESERHGTDEFFPISKKILSRDSSVGCSNYYCRNPEGVPFEWEREPGTPKVEEQPQSADPLPPLSPPPAVLSLTLPKRCIEEEEEISSFSIRSRLKILKRIIKKYQAKRSEKNKLQKGNDNNTIAIDRSKVLDGGVESFGVWSSDRDDFAGSSPPRNSSSSSLVSAALSFSGGSPPPAVATIESPTSLHQPSISCIPLKISAILVYVTKRL